MSFFRTRPFLSGFLALLIYLQAMIPAGYMPDLAALAQGEVKIVLCSAQGAQQLDGAQHGLPLKADKKACAFSLMPQTALLETAPALFSSVFYAPASQDEFVSAFIFSFGHQTGQPRAPPRA